MGKIGRNQPCPCGSGKKYKHCCRSLEEEQQKSDQNDVQVTLHNAISKIQQSAQARQEEFFELGVFIFFSNNDGDAWLLEVTESDAVQLAAKGTALDVPIEENSETIEVNWSHTFTVLHKQFFLTAYDDKSQVKLDNVPTQRISAGIKRMKKRFSPELLEQVHISQETFG